MNIKFLPFLLCTICYHLCAQQVDVKFSRNGLYLFKELGMESSQIIDYNLTDQGQLYVLYESDIHRRLIRLQEDGTEDDSFKFTSVILDNEGTSPVAMSATEEGTVVVLSNLWNGLNWMIHINEFFENGKLNPNFGRRGIYTKSILNNADDNFGQYLHTSPNGEIIVVAKINDFSVSTTDEKIAILKLSRDGRTLSSDLYANRCYKLDSSAMQDDYLLLAYSSGTTPTVPVQASYLAGVDSEQMVSQKVHCLSTGENFETIDHIVVTHSAVYISHLKLNAEALYLIRKYDLDGNLDETFADTGEVHGSADLYDSSFVVGDKGELYVVSKSLHDDYELLIKKLNNDGSIDETFGENGIASIAMRYPIIALNKIQFDGKNLLYVAGDMAIEGNTFGFVTKIKTDVLQLKKEKLDKFIRTLFVKRG